MTRDQQRDIVRLVQEANTLIGILYQRISVATAGTDHPLRAEMRTLNDMIPSLALIADLAENTEVPS